MLYGIARSTNQAKANARMPHGKVSFGNRCHSGMSHPPQHRATDWRSHPGSCIGMLPIEKVPATCATPAIKTNKINSRSGSLVMLSSLRAS